MNCRVIEPLLLAGRKDPLTPEQESALAGHLAACPACAQQRDRLAAALVDWKADVAVVALPDIDQEWQVVRGQLQPSGKKTPVRRLAPVIWFGTTLAAAAALIFAFLVQPGKAPAPAAAGTPATVTPEPVVAQAKLTDAADTNASTMVYVDKESGWLVVWATDVDTKTSG